MKRPVSLPGDDEEVSILRYDQAVEAVDLCITFEAPTQTPEAIRLSRSTCSPPRSRGEVVQPRLKSTPPRFARSPLSPTPPTKRAAVRQLTVKPPPPTPASSSKKKDRRRSPKEKHESVDYDFIDLEIEDSDHPMALKGQITPLGLRQQHDEIRRLSSSGKKGRGRSRDIVVEVDSETASVGSSDEKPSVEIFVDDEPRKVDLVIVDDDDDDDSPVAGGQQHRKPTPRVSADVVGVTPPTATAKNQERASVDIDREEEVLAAYARGDVLDAAESTKKPEEAPPSRGRDMTRQASLLASQQQNKKKKQQRRNKQGRVKRTSSEKERRSAASSTSPPPMVVSQEPEDLVRSGRSGSTVDDERFYRRRPSDIVDDDDAYLARSDSDLHAEDLQAAFDKAALLEEAQYAANRAAEPAAAMALARREAEASERKRDRLRRRQKVVNLMILTLIALAAGIFIQNNQIAIANLYSLVTTPQTASLLPAAAAAAAAAPEKNIIAKQEQQPQQQRRQQQRPQQQQRPTMPPPAENKKTPPTPPARDDFNAAVAPSPPPAPLRRKRRFPRPFG